MSDRRNMMQEPPNTVNSRTSNRSDVNTPPNDPNTQVVSDAENPRAEGLPTPTELERENSPENPEIEVSESGHANHTDAAASMPPPGFDDNTPGRSGAAEARKAVLDRGVPESSLGDTAEDATSKAPDANVDTSNSERDPRNVDGTNTPGQGNE